MRISDWISDVCSSDLTLLNSPIINAFALPGGYVYITRGLVALAENEAEVAGVMGHEIGHVIARHSAQRMSRGLLAPLGTLGASILGQVAGVGPIGEIAQIGAGAYLPSFSREQEFAAAPLGEIRSSSGRGRVWWYLENSGV